MKFIIAPDSFKGSISAKEFCKIAEKTILAAKKDAQVISMPLADGGEGSLECINAALQGTVSEITVTGPFFNTETLAKIGFYENGKTAVIESAMAMGLPLTGNKKNPELTTTYGVGQMIGFAIKAGAEKIIMALGGSSTNDCGAGMLCALGAVFRDNNGKEFIPTGGTLKDVSSADFSLLKKNIAPQGKKVSFVAMCDVTNPLCGENGCSAVFGPQKGADSSMVARLDKGCRHFSQIVQNHLLANCNFQPEKQQISFAEVPGAGAAGGLGFACVSALEGILKSGIETILQLYNFVSALQNCDYIITGEGKFDSQSLMGKTIGGILNQLEKTQKLSESTAPNGNNASAKDKSFSSLSESTVPLIIFCGKNQAPENTIFKTPLEIIEISTGYQLEYSIEHGAQLLEQAMKKWLEKI
ncbi:MAG: glycerate kinase [Treponema sp.]|nr:glycerate kinase [Treponema sp.]